MLIDLNSHQLINDELVKSITRAEAKGVHKELPPGGQWRTIKGHHIYIKDGKVLAGAVPGVTKAKKATKAQLTEHQATIDAQGTKKDEKTKSKDTGKAKRPKTQRSGATGADKAKTAKKPGKSAQSKGKGVKKDDKKIPKSPAKAPKGVRPGTDKPASTRAKTSTIKPPSKKAGSKTPAKKEEVNKRFVVVQDAGKAKGTKIPTPPKEKANAKTTKGAGKDGSKPTKPTAKKPATKSTDASGTKRPVQKRATKAKPASEAKPKSKATTKKTGVKDIRSEAQKNRELAYDVGDKVGGARKDDFEKQFKEKPSLNTLAQLEGESGAVAQKLVTKKNILPPFSFEAEHKGGTDLPTALMKKMLFDRIAPKPEEDTPEGRKAYMDSINKFNRHIGGIKTLENMQNAIRELADWAYKGKNGLKSEDAMANKHRYSYINEESHNKQIEAGKEARKNLDFSPLGDKLVNFFTDYKSRESSFRTISKNMKDGWEKYLNPEKKTGTKAPKGGENKRWERKAEAEHLRKGGRKTAVAKPEDLVKDFGIRGVEFGHWVNDSSGKYHLQRSAEAFQDLADIVGIDDKDVSLNGRLAIAFGARGSGTALAHYEPDRKVINMTKYGGAGSLAHEWGHAMDNIMYQYSHGGAESLNLASEGNMGDNDPKLKALYENVMNAIKNPAPGEKGAVQKIPVNTEENRFGSYLPARRDMVRTQGIEATLKHHTDEINEKHDRYIASVKENRRGFYKTQKDIDKQVAKYNRERTKALKQLPHEIAYDHFRNTGEHVKKDLMIPTGTSNYMQAMKDGDGDRKEYLAQPAEMFARVFESYVQGKLDKAKRYNNYLVHGTREANVKSEGAPFPEGKERTHMFKAMESLLKHISSKNTLKKAIILEMLANGRGDLTEELRKSHMKHLLNEVWRENTTGVEAKRSAYNVENPEEVIYIPVNRLRVVYQTDKATNWDKVTENQERMRAGENLAPVTIGLDYDIHDGHHRYEASKLEGYEHIPCEVKGGNDLERARAIEAYREVWKSHTTNVPHMLQHLAIEAREGHHEAEIVRSKPDYRNMIIHDMVAPSAFEEDNEYMYRGIGHRELLYIAENGHIQSKGKGNDSDKEKSTCFSNLYSQAVGYAKSNYDLYNEPQAYILAVPKQGYPEDDHGEIVADGHVSVEGMKIIPVPKS